MAIQPVDLQLAYLATPQSAAVASVAQEVPAQAAAAAQQAFAAHFEQREETINESPEAEGAKIRADRDGHNAPEYAPGKRRRRGVLAGQTDEPATGSDGEKHFIDTTA